MQQWVSEQSLCTLTKVRRECGADAEHFYTELQQNVFDERFPLICPSPVGHMHAHGRTTGHTGDGNINEHTEHDDTTRDNQCAAKDTHTTQISYQ
jgi:hypothetical protein